MLHTLELEQELSEALIEGEEIYCLINHNGEHEVEALLLEIQADDLVLELITGEEVFKTFEDVYALIRD